jgi:copper chaperone CopZ
MKKINLNIKGMHCPSCETLIKDSLEEFDGVKSVSISHKTGKAGVEFDETKIDEAQIRKIIKNEGYKVE